MTSGDRQSLSPGDEVALSGPVVTLAQPVLVPSIWLFDPVGAGEL